MTFDFLKATMFNILKFAITPTNGTLWKTSLGYSLVVQWLGLCALIAKGTGSIPGQGTKIPQATQCGQKNQTKTKTKTVWINEKLL